MIELWRLPAEVLIQQDVFRCRIDPLFAANHMGNFHEVIIHHISEMVSWHAVRLNQYLHIDLRPGDIYLATQDIFKFALTVSRNLHANHMLIACRLLRFTLFPSQAQAMTIVTGLTLVQHLLLAHLIESLGATETAKSGSIVQQLLNMLRINRRALTLPIRASTTLTAGALVPRQAQPLKRAKNVLFRLACATLSVRIFYAQHEVTTVLVCKAAIE